MTRALGALLLLLALPAAAQTPDSTLTDSGAVAAPPVAPPSEAPRADSAGAVTRSVAPPTVPLPAIVARPAAGGAPRDTSRAASRALRRSLLVPGWGQLTNGQTAKVPVVAGALVGAAAYLVVQQRRYTLYRRSALFAGCREAPDRPVCDDVAGAEDEWRDTGTPTFAQAAAVRNTVRGRRDVAGLVVGVVYALQALDAYIAAQLLGFDVDEDVAVRVSPGGFALRVQL